METTGPGSSEVEAINTKLSSVPLRPAPSRKLPSTSQAGVSVTLGPEAKDMHASNPPQVSSEAGQLPPNRRDGKDQGQTQLSPLAALTHAIGGGSKHTGNVGETAAHLFFGDSHAEHKKHRMNHEHSPFHRAHDHHHHHHEHFSDHEKHHKSIGNPADQQGWDGAREEHVPSSPIAWAEHPSRKENANPDQSPFQRAVHGLSRTLSGKLDRAGRPTTGMSRAASKRRMVRGMTQGRRPGTGRLGLQVGVHHITVSDENQAEDAAADIEDILNMSAKRHFREMKYIKCGAQDGLFWKDAMWNRIRPSGGFALSYQHWFPDIVVAPKCTEEAPAQGSSLEVFRCPSSDEESSTIKKAEKQEALLRTDSDNELESLIQQLSEEKGQIKKEPSMPVALIPAKARQRRRSTQFEIEREDGEEEELEFLEFQTLDTEPNQEAKSPENGLSVDGPRRRSLDSTQIGRAGLRGEELRPARQRRLSLEETLHSSFDPRLIAASEDSGSFRPGRPRRLSLEDGQKQRRASVLSTSLEMEIDSPLPGSPMPSQEIEISQRPQGSMQMYSTVQSVSNEILNPSSPMASPRRFLDKPGNERRGSLAVPQNPAMTPRMIALTRSRRASAPHIAAAQQNLLG